LILPANLPVPLAFAHGEVFQFDWREVYVMIVVNLPGGNNWKKEIKLRHNLANQGGSILDAKPGSNLNAN